MPDPKARDPHTLIFDQHGTLWFTVQQGNFVGRLDPKTGKVALVMAPTPDSRPYGIVVNSRGVPFFDLFNTNKIGSIDPSSLAIREYTLPSPEARPRRIAIGRDDIVYYTDFARGMLGVLEPGSGKVTEFATPGGSGSRPVRDGGHKRRRRVVQRVRRAAEHPGPLRPVNQGHAIVANPLRWRRGATHGGGPERRAVAGVQRRRPHRQGEMVGVAFGQVTRRRFRKSRCSCRHPRRADPTWNTTLRERCWLGAAGVESRASRGRARCPGKPGKADWRTTSCHPR